MREIVTYDIMDAPALVMNGEGWASGQAPRREATKGLGERTYRQD